MAESPAGVIRRPVPARLLTSESVVGGGYQYVYQYARALPTPIDDVTTDLGDSIYDKMLFDSQVAACMQVFKASILEEGVAFAPAIDDVDDPQYELAAQISDECERMWDDLQEAPDDVLWNLLDALALGNKLAEQVYEVRARITDGKTGLQLASLKVKPRHSYLFVVDAFVNLVGILGRRLGDAGPNMSGAMIDPNSPPPNLFDPSKFAIVTFRPHDNDPRGTSVLRPAYDPWWRKRQALTEFVKFLAQFAGPSIWATTPEGAQSELPLDFLGNTVPYVAPNSLDPLGNPVTVANAPLSPEQDLLAKLQQFRNGTVAAFPFGTVLNTIQMTGEGRAFLNAIAECNMSITKAILTQTLTTEEGEHQARAAAQVHQDVLDTLVRQGKRSVVRMMQKQILRPWVAMNWGDAVAAKLTPNVSLGTTEQQDLAPLMTAIAALQNAGYLHPSQLPDIDDELGLPVRDLTQDVVTPGQEPDGGPQSGTGAAAAGDGATAPPSGAPSQSDQPQSNPQQPAQQQPQDETPPGKVNVRPHIRNRPKRRTSLLIWRPRAYA